MVILYKKWKKYNEIQITKRTLTIEKSSTLPRNEHIMLVLYRWKKYYEIKLSNPEGVAERL